MSPTIIRDQQQPVPDMGSIQLQKPGAVGGSRVYAVLPAIVVCALLLLAPRAALCQQNPFLKQAIRHFAAYELPQATAKLKQALLWPRNSKKERALIFIYRGMCEALRGQLPAAKKSFAVALKLDPSAKLPPGSPRRFRRLLASMRGGGGGTPTRAAPRRAPPPPPSALVVRRPKPKKKKAKGMSFGEGFVFSGARKPKKKPKPSPWAPAVTRKPKPRSEPVTTVRRPRRSRRVDTPPTPRRRSRRTATAGRTRGLLGQDPELAREARRGKGRRGIPVAAWISAAAAVALAGGGVVLGVMAKSTHSDAALPETMQVDVPHLEENARTKALVSNVLFGTAGVAAVGAVIFFLQGSSSTKPKPVVLLPARAGAALVATWQF